MSFVYRTFINTLYKFQSVDNNMKQFKDLFEELTKAEELKADKMTDRDHYSNRMAFLEMHHPDTGRLFRTNYSGDKPLSLRVPISITEHSGAPNSNVLDFLHSKNLTTTHEDYKAGHAYEEKETKGNSELGIEPSIKRVKIRIGALLEKHKAPDEIKKAFTNDTFRTGAKRTEYDMIISGHPHDVFGMSTGRNGAWTSCATMRNGETKWVGGDGPAARKMSDEINNHTHTVYLVPRGGNVDTDAIARLNFKHHTGISTRHETLLSEGVVYGTAPNAFKSIAEEHMGKLFSVNPNEVYVKNKKVYSDNGKPLTITSDQLHPDIIDSAWKHLSKDEDSKQVLISHVVPGEKYKSTKLAKLANTLNKLRNTTDFSEYVKNMNFSNIGFGYIEKHGIYDNKHYREDIDRAAKLFDMNNENHRETFNGLDTANHEQHNLRYAIRNNLPKAKTATDFENLLKITDINDTTPIRISENHSLGKNPLEAITRHLSNKDMLTTDTFSRAYLSAHTLSDGNLKTGNLYDSSVKFEQDGIPGMSNIISHNANKLLNKFNSDSGLAKAFINMKPNTRQRYADAMGIDHNKLISAYKSKFPKGWDKDLASTQNYIKKLAASNPKHGYVNLNDVINGPDFNNHKYLKNLVDIIS